MEKEIKQLKRSLERLTKEYDKATKRKDKFLMRIILEAMQEESKRLEELEK